jgi:hypothetical protein
MIFPLKLFWDFPIAMVDYQGVYSVTGDFTGVNKRRSLFQQHQKKIGIQIHGRMDMALVPGKLGIPQKIAAFSQGSGG